MGMWEFILKNSAVTALFTAIMIGLGFGIYKFTEDRKDLKEAIMVSNEAVKSDPAV